LQPRNGSELTDDAYLIADLALDSLLLWQRREPLGVHVRDRLDRDCGVAFGVNGTPSIGDDDRLLGGDDRALSRPAVQDAFAN
jgi:hypothetical protein